MKVSLNFLKNYVDIKIPPKKLADLLALHTAEVENVEDFKEDYKNVFAARIFDIKKHPNADDLFVAKADLGVKKIQIIFGKTFPVNEGEMLPVAAAPATLKIGIVVKKVNLRGVSSEGMITSDAELGLPITEEGLVRFSSKIKPGTSLCKALDLEDVVFEIDILPNRAPDLLSHFGVAREVAALTGAKLKNIEIITKENNYLRAADFIEIKVQDKNLCSRYVARVIDNVKIGESPLALKSRLIASGVRPINNVVDITNYVMLELGQPLHAFDFQKLEGKSKKKIIVRRAKRGEAIFTLDGKKRELTPETLVIADEKRGMAIAGIMGGRNSEITVRTKRIILESANFNPINIRKSSKALNLKTEASIRFEKGLDQNLAEKAIDRAAYLIEKIAKGNALSGKIDVYPRKAFPKKLVLDISYINKFLGIQIPEKEIVDILERLSFKIKRAKKGFLNVEAPFFRLDINIPEELIEEIARIYGYDRIEATPPREGLTAEIPNEYFGLRRNIKSILKNLSFSEIYNYSFQKENLLKKVGFKEKNHLEVLNPIDQEMRFLRASILPGLFSNTKKNLRNFESFRIFEIGKVFLARGLDKMPLEKYILGGVLVGKSESFYTTKGIVEELFKELGINFSARNLRFVSKDLKEPYFGVNFWHPGKAAEVIFGRNRVGVFGVFHPELINKLEINKELFGFSFDLDLLLKIEKSREMFKPLPKYPEARRDLSIVVGKEITAEKTSETIKKAGNNFVKNIDLFDMYESEKIGKGKKSLAFHISYMSESRTLSDSEVNEIEKKVENSLEKKLKAEIRRK